MPNVFVMRSDYRTNWTGNALDENCSTSVRYQIRVTDIQLTRLQYGKGIKIIKWQVRRPILMISNKKDHDISLQDTANKNSSQNLSIMQFRAKPAFSVVSDVTDHQSSGTICTPKRIHTFAVKQGPGRKRR
nr:unnamed protein product [Callosobruchus chinensis]